MVARHAQALARKAAPMFPVALPMAVAAAAVADVSLLARKF
jgi:hypothetical protein